MVFFCGDSGSLIADGSGDGKSACRLATLRGEMDIAVMMAEVTVRGVGSEARSGEEEVWWVWGAVRQLCREDASRWCYKDEKRSREVLPVDEVVDVTGLPSQRLYRRFHPCPAIRCKASTGLAEPGRT